MILKNKSGFMNWYKKASITYPVWLAEEIVKLTNNYSKPLPGHYPYYFPKIEKWVKETNPNLNDFDFDKAAASALAYEHDKEPENSPEAIRRNMNAFYADSQSISPDAPNFAVDIRKKGKSIPANIRRKINNAIHDLGNYHQEIPLQNIFDICKQYDIVPLQEDGTVWSGFLIGGKECGSEEAKDQIAHFDLAIRGEGGKYIPANNMICLTWCKMTSGKYEIVCYVS